MATQADSGGQVTSRRGEGWVAFAGIMLMVAAVMRFFDAIWAFSYHAAIPEGFQGAIFGHSLRTYGWVYLAVAVVLFLAAWGVFLGSQAARWIGIVAGAVECISAVWWLPYYPWWSITYVALGVLVIYALAAHGGEAVV